MARIRTIKPSFFESEDVAVLPFRARLLWIGLWTHCDDQGRTKDNTKLIKARIWPLDQVSLRDIEEDLQILADHGRITRYQAGGQAYLAITNWGEHQNINRPTASKIPPPPNALTENSVSPHVTVTEGSLGEGKGKEGKGRDAREGMSPQPPAPSVAGPRPLPRCSTHINDPDPPACGKCKDARKLAEAWDADRRAAARDAPQCRTHRGQPAHNCAGCRADQLAGASP